MIRMIPNILTSLRIAGSLLLIFSKPLASAFYIIYTLSGLTDVLDGFIARRFNASSELGKKLDSAADLLFYAVMLIKLFPTLFAVLPRSIWIAVGVIIILRLISYGTAAVKHRKFASLHTLPNKLTGVVMFAVPYFVGTRIFTALCITVCAVSFVAAVHELSVHTGAARLGRRHG